MGYLYIAVGACGLLSMFGWWMYDLHTAKYEPPETGHAFDQAVGVYALTRTVRTKTAKQTGTSGTLAVTADLRAPAVTEDLTELL